MDKQYLSAVSLLPSFLQKILSVFTERTELSVTEIRLRSEKPIGLTTDRGTVYPTAKGYSLLPSIESIKITADQLHECFIELCNRSVYSHEQELSQGYLILKGGHRAGVCGRVVKKQNGDTWITDISSINIRIAHEVKGIAERVYGQTAEAKGLLICGPPHSGKTTLLRDYIRIASNRGNRVAVVDCRGEIAAVKNCICGLDVGVNTDVITGGEKAQGIETALRVMTPDIISFDEIGSRDELMKISDCLNSGVSIITTLHCESREQLISRNKYLPLLETMAFSHFVFLDSCHNALVLKECEILGETDGSVSSNNILYDGRFGTSIQAV